MKYPPRKVFVLEDGVYEELSYIEFRQREDIYQGRRFILLHGMLMEVSESDYKAFYKDKRRQKYLDERSAKNGDFSYDMLATDEFNGEDTLRGYEVIQDEFQMICRNRLLMAGIVNRIIEINELNGVKSADYEQKSAREAAPQEVEAMTEEELRQRNRAMNADFITQFIDEVQPHAAPNPTTLAERGSAAPSGVWSTSTASGRQSVRERVMEIRRDQSAPQPSWEEAAQNFYEANLKNLSVSTRE